MQASFLGPPDDTSVPEKGPAGTAAPSDPSGPAWLVGTYRPTAPFSLRTTTSTSSGGKTLLLPTPYGVKLALVDATIRAEGVPAGRALFDIVKGRAVRFRPPRHAVVNNTFVKVWREQRDAPPDRPYGDTIAYRELCCYTGDLEVAMGVTAMEQPERERIGIAMAHVNYFGKRGSFMQFLGTRLESALTEDFSVPVPEWQANGGGAWGSIQPLDDLGEIQAPDLFDRINTYSDKRAELLKHRLLIYTVVPYRLRSSSRSYSHYQREA